MSINKLFVEVFTILEKYSDLDKFNKLKNLYGTITLNDNLLLKYINDYEKLKNNIWNLNYFNNTNIEVIIPKLTDEENIKINNNFKSIYELSKKKLLSVEKKECKDNNCKDCNVSNKKKIKKMLNKKGIKQILESQLGKQMGKKDINIEELLTKSLENELPEGEFNMLKTLLNNPMLKNITKKLLNEENLEKLKNIFNKIMEDEEILNEVDKIKNIFNETKLTNFITETFDNLKDLNDITKIQGFVENNTELKEIGTKLENAMESGLIDKEKIKKLFEKTFDKVKNEVINMGILNKDNMNNIQQLISSFNLGGEEKVLTKEERRQKRIKKNRRQIREKLKNKKKNRNRNNRKKNNKKDKRY
jgi:hypothetical protein